MTFCLCGQTYHIGDLYTAPDGSKGIVYFLFPDGSGGWVVALNDALTVCKWGEALDIPEIPNLMYEYTTYQQANFDTAGYQKTAIIRAFQNNSLTYAAGKVDFANGWYLPSPAQLSVLFAQRPFINDAILNAGGSLMSGDWYWTSSESDYQNACAVHFGGSGSSGRGDYRFNQNKSVNCNVRAVRSFSYAKDNPYLMASYSWSAGDTTQSITLMPTQTASYVVTVSSSAGCADTVEHTIVVKESSNEEITQIACDNYEWNGQTYTQSGDYSVNYQRMNGCDSVVTLHLTIEPTPEITITPDVDTICLGNDVTIQASVGNTSVPVILVPEIAVGDILCTDGSIVKPSLWPVPGKTAKGVVFYVDNSGMHGWAVHLVDQGVDLTWGGYGVDILDLHNHTGHDAYADMDGYSNTQAIRAAGNATTYPAAYAVDFDNGWYLPASGQFRLVLAMLFFVNPSIELVGGTPISTDDFFMYWTSTEYSGIYAGYMENYDSGGLLKSFTGSVRSVCSF